MPRGGLIPELYGTCFVFPGPMNLLSGFLLAGDGLYTTRVASPKMPHSTSCLLIVPLLHQVNSISMLSATHAEAVQAVRQSVDRVTLMVCDGYNQDAYMTPQGVDEAARDKKRQALIHRKSQIFDPSACVSY